MHGSTFFKIRRCSCSLSDEDEDVLGVRRVRAGVYRNGKLEPEVLGNRDQRKAILLGVFGHFSAQVPEAVEGIAFGVGRDVDDLLDVDAVSDLADQQPVDAQPSRVQNHESIAGFVFKVTEKSRHGFDEVSGNEGALVGHAEYLGIVFSVGDVIVEPDDVTEAVAEEDGVDANAATNLKEDGVLGPASLRIEGGPLVFDVVQMDVRSDDAKKLFFGADICRKETSGPDVKLVSQERHLDSGRSENELEFGLLAAAEVDRKPLKVEACQAGVSARSVPEKVTEFQFFRLNLIFGQILGAHQDGRHQLPGLGIGPDDQAPPKASVIELEVSGQLGVPDVVLEGGGNLDVRVLDDGDVQRLDAHQTSLGRADEEPDCFRVAIETLK